MAPNILGSYECPKCGWHYIRAHGEISIWFVLDDFLQLAQIKCTDCGTIVEDHIPFFEVAAFRNHGVKVKEFNDKFNKLTEQDIENWDLEKEFKDAIG